MGTLKIILGLAAGGYWVYLVQTKKEDFAEWEYWTGLGVGAYWAWLALSAPSKADMDLLEKVKLGQQKLPEVKQATAPQEPPPRIKGNNGAPESATVTVTPAQIAAVRKMLTPVPAPQEGAPTGEPDEGAVEGMW